MKNMIRKPAQACMAVALSFAMVCGLSACKTTDFFTEVVITPFADKVDYDNPEKNTVNSPDAEQESSTLSALEWTDESARSQEVQSLVVYASDPTTTLSTHHSIFDLSPMFPGIEASDGVRLVFDASAALDHEVESAGEQEQAADSQSTSVGGTESVPAAQASSSEQAPDDASAVQSESGSPDGSNGGSGNEVGEQGGSNVGDDPNGGGTDLGDLGNTTNPEGPGKEETPDPPETPGKDEDPYKGYDGTVSVYDPGNAFEEVQHVQHLAVLGYDASVMAQAIGGEGAICAMSVYAWNGLDSSGNPGTTASVFSEVFANESSSITTLWNRDGSSPSDLADVNALVSACGENGVIVYDQRLGDQTTLFNDDQRKELYAAGIQLVPVELSTVQGMLDAARVIGDALSESTECAQDAQTMADSYIDTVGNIVSAVANTHGGSLAGNRMLTTYNGCPVTSLKTATTYSFIATDSEAGLSYTGTNAINVSRIVLFGNNSTWLETPLSFWQQAAGTWDGLAESYSFEGLVALWPLNEVPNASTLTGGTAGGARSRWMASDLTQRTTGDMGTPFATADQGAGLGTSSEPYVIVCASDGKSAGEVKDALVQSMASYSESGELTPYSVMPYAKPDESDAMIDPGLPIDLATRIASSIGERGGFGAELIGKVESPFYSGLALDSVVRENPVGLLGSWTEGSMESVLEAVWLADIYSKSPSGCAYEPITDMSSFSVNIGGTTCTSTYEAVIAFYKTFYRVGVESAYSSIVTDEGV